MKLFFSACVCLLSSVINPAFAADSTRISVGALRFTSHAPTFIAVEKGYFAEQGLDAELKFFQPSLSPWLSPPAILILA